MERKRAINFTAFPQSSFTQNLNNLLPHNPKKSFSVKIDNPSENYFASILFLLNKPFRTVQDIHIIMDYFQSLTEFNSMIQSMKRDNYNEILYKLSFSMKHEYHEANKLIFRFGDKGDKFYIILKGSVDVLYPKDSKMLMSEQEYLYYLERLRSLGEEEIIKNLSIANSSAFNIDYNLLRVKNNEKSEVKRRTNCMLIQTRVHEFLNLMKGTNPANSEDYIEKSAPKLDLKISKRTDQKKEAKVWVYHHIITLKEGDYFGDSAFNSVEMKRTASIMTRENCDFGVLDKENFVYILKEITNKKRSNNVSLLLSTQYFSRIDKIYFQKNHFNYFVFETYKIHETLIHEGEKADYIYFIKEGEFELSLKKNLLELSDIIKIYGGKVKVDMEEKDKIKFDKRFCKLMNEKKKIRVSIVKKNEFLGFEDIVYDGKYIYSISCVTSVGEIFKIKKQFFRSIYEKETYILSMIRENVKIKKNYFLDRLINIRESKLSSYDDSNNDIFSGYNSRELRKSDTMTRESFIETKESEDAFQQKMLKSISKNTFTDFRFLKNKSELNFNRKLTSNQNIQRHAMTPNLSSKNTFSNDNQSINKKDITVVFKDSNKINTFNSISNTEIQKLNSKNSKSIVLKKNRSIFSSKFDKKHENKNKFSTFKSKDFQNENDFIFNSSLKLETAKKRNFSERKKYGLFFEMKKINSELNKKFEKKEFKEIVFENLAKKYYTDNDEEESINKQKESKFNRTHQAGFKSKFYKDFQNGKSLNEFENLMTNDKVKKAILPSKTSLNFNSSKSVNSNINVIDCLGYDKLKNMFRNIIKDDTIFKSKDCLSERIIGSNRKSLKLFDFKKMKNAFKKQTLRIKNDKLVDLHILK